MNQGTQKQTEVGAVDRSSSGLSGWVKRGAMAFMLGGVLAHGAAWGQDTVCGVLASKCTSNDLFNASSFSVDTSAVPPNCAAGQIVNVPVSVRASTANTNGNRYSIGIEYGVAGAACTIIPAQIPGPLTGFAGAVPGFTNLNGDAVGDLSGSTGAGYINFTVPTACSPNAAGVITLQPLLGFGTPQDKATFASVAADPTPKCYVDTLTYSPKAITGKLTVSKVVNGGTGGSFPFAVSGGTAPAPASFNLAGGASQVVSVTMAPTGTTAFTVTETPLANYALSSATCSNWTSGTAVPLTTTAVTNGVQFSMSPQNAYDVRCTFVNQDTAPPPAGSLTVTKTLNGAGQFNLTATAGGTTLGSASNVGNGGTFTVASITAGTSVTVAETAGTGTNLANYSSVLTCSGGGVSVQGTTSGTFTMPTGAAVTCGFTNTRLTNTVVVKKALSPTTDGGHFDLLLNGAVVKAAAGHGDASSAVTVAVGDSITVSENPNADYTSSLTCTGAAGLPTNATGTTGNFTMPNAPVECTFTNTRKTNTLTVNKVLSPSTDPGRFDLTVNDVTKASAAGHNGTTGTLTVDVGSAVMLAELGNAGAGTVLADYDSVLSCTGVTTSGTTSGGFVMPNAPVSCTFTNTRKPLALTVTKAVLPTGDAGKFNLLVNNVAKATDIGDGGTTGAVLVTPGASVTVSESGGTGTTLSDYASVLTCTGVNGYSETVTTTGTFTMPGNAVDCKFTNTHKRSSVSVNKSSSVTGPLKPGGSVTYTVTVTNSGELALSNVVVNDPVPSGIASQSWTCSGGPAGTCPAGSTPGPINNHTIASLPVGATVTYTITATAAASLPPTVTNTATLTIPSGTTCAANGVAATPCAASVSNPPAGAVSVTKTSSVSGALAPGGSVTYTVVVTNTGPVAVNGVAVSDLVPSGIAAGQTWTCTGSGTTCKAGGTDAVSDTVNLPVGASVTYIITATAASSLPPVVTNTATVTPPSDAQCYIDGKVANPCSVSVSNPPMGAVSVTKTSSVTGSLAPGGSVTYKVVVTNTGPVAVNNVSVNDPVPTGVASQTWTCAGSGATCVASGTGAVSDTVNLPAGASVTYTITATAAANLPPVVTNTATVTPPTDTQCYIDGKVASPCSVSVSNPPTGVISVSKTSSVTGTLSPGGSVTYTVVVTNTGAVAVSNVAVSDPVPAGIVTSQTWTCAGTGGATCKASGSGAITDTIASMPAGSAVTYTITATADSTLPAQVTNTVTVTPPTDTQCYIDGKVASPCSVSVSNPPTPPAPGVTAIPTTSPEGLIALALMMLGAAGWASRRARQRR